MTIKRVEMERRYDGTFPPNRFRYVCDSGHHHPSRRHAGKCNDRQHKASVQAADRAKGRPVAEVMVGDIVAIVKEARADAAMEAGDS